MSGRGRGTTWGESARAYRRDEAAAQDSDRCAGKAPEAVDAQVAEFEVSARHPLLTKLQNHAQQNHGESSLDGDRAAFDGQPRQKRQPRVSAEMQDLGADPQPSDGAHHGRRGGEQLAEGHQEDAEEPESV